MSPPDNDLSLTHKGDDSLSPFNRYMLMESDGIWFIYPLINGFIVEMSTPNKEELQEKRDAIHEATLRYRMYLLSRRDFLRGIIIGVTGSITAGYIIQLDQLLFGDYTVVSIGFRILLFLAILGYFLLQYQKRTEEYEAAIKTMLETINQIDQTTE